MGHARLFYMNKLLEVKIMGICVGGRPIQGGHGEIEREEIAGGGRLGPGFFAEMASRCPKKNELLLVTLNITLFLGPFEYC